MVHARWMVRAGMPLGLRGSFKVFQNGLLAVPS